MVWSRVGCGVVGCCGVLWDFVSCGSRLICGLYCAWAELWAVGRGLGLLVGGLWAVGRACFTN